VSNTDENGRDRGDASSQSRRLDLIELIPGEHYLVFFDADPGTLPDEDAIEELRILAYMARDKPVLGLAEQAVAVTVAEAVSGNLISEAIWERFPAAWRFVRHWRERRKSAAPATAEEAGEAAVQAVQAVESSSTPPAAPSAAPLVSEADIEVTTPQGEAVKVSVRTPGKWVQVTVETTCSCAEVTIKS